MRKEDRAEIPGRSTFWDSLTSGLVPHGRWVIKQKTAKDRVSRAVKRMKVWLRAVRIESPRAACELVRKVRGHDQYYGITGNWQALHDFRYQVQRTWRKWLSYRSQQGYMDWARMNRLLERIRCRGRSFTIPCTVA